MTTDDPIPMAHISPFEQIKHVDEDVEYWSGRELGQVLGYGSWRAFRAVIEKAQIACEGAGGLISSHFVLQDKMVRLGLGMERKIEDFQLSRYACYLILQNADPSKRIVAIGQSYFAIQTRRQELADQLIGKTEAEQRIIPRDQIAEQNGHLAEAASGAGVITQRDFAIFQDHGYRGLYRETARQIAVRKSIHPGEHILDYRGPEESVNNLFRIVQAEAKIRREGISTKEGANATHYQVGDAVRTTIISLGGTPPEQLPTPEKSIQQLRRDEARQQRITEEDRLGLFAALMAGNQDDEAESSDDEDGMDGLADAEN